MWITLFLLLTLACNNDSISDFRPTYGNRILAASKANYSQVDSVFKQLERSSKRSDQIDSLIVYADRILNEDEIAALRYATAANKLATQKNQNLERGISFYYLSLILGRREFDQSGIDRPFFYGQFSYRLFRTEKNPYWQALSLSQIGDLYRRKAALDSARIYFQHSLNIVEGGRLLPKDSLSLRADLMHSLGMIAFSKENFSGAQQYYKQADSIFAVLGDTSAILRLKSNQGLLFLTQGLYSLADSLLGLGLEWGIQQQDKNGLERIYEILSLLRIYQYLANNGDEEHFEDAILFAQEGLRDATKNQHVFYNQIGLVYQQKLSFVNSAQDRISVSDSALRNYYQALSFAQKDAAISTTRALMSNISILCDYRKESLNVDCQGILNASTDQFLNNAYDTIVNNIKGDLKDLNKQIVEVEKQEIINRESKNRQLQQIIGGAIFLVALLSFLLLYQQLQKKRLSAKMEALRAQINPHFISNSLNAIENLVNQDKKEAAAKYLIHFSRFSRKILNSSRSGFTSLANELDTIEHFLALEQLRFRNKLNYHVFADDSLDTQQIEVPAMVIQPYVENAILHGLKPKKQQGTLYIQVGVDAKYLRIVIEDDGIGREKSKELQAASVLQKNRKSQGMQITAERIKSMGKVKGKHVEIIDLFDEDGRAEGTKVVLRLPLKRKKTKT